MAKRWGQVLVLLAVTALAAAEPPCRAPDTPPPFPRVALQVVAEGLDRPVHIAVAGGRSDRLYVVEQAGAVRVLERTALMDRPFVLAHEPFLDLRRQVESGGEKGLLSIAFHPRYRDEGVFFVNYTARDERGLHTRVSRFKRQTDLQADAASETVVLRVDQPYANHNGGQLAFGPDGYLYIGMGDGGSANDPHDHAQDPGSLLGKLLRIDIDRADPGLTYAAPADNPFVNRPGYHPEIWALGLRNPWRFGFDAGSAVLYLADVGQNRVEEIDIIRKGGNYGWPVMEGGICTPGVNPICNPTGFEPPLFTYRHPEGRSVTGGFVYRGQAIPGLCGAYLYADYVTRRLWALRVRDGRVSAQAELLRTAGPISSFGQDAEHELYLADHGNGRVYRLVAARP
jgi:glucose/arabinose dehydrogenase